MPETRKDQIEASAKQFHRDNPLVWRHFVRFTLLRIRVGFKHYSSNAIFERIRWEEDIASSDGLSTFRINNNYRPYYARWFANAYPDHADFFRTRALTSEGDRPAVDQELEPQDYHYSNGEENHE